MVMGIEWNNKYKALARGLVYYKHLINVSCRYDYYLLHMKNWNESGISMAKKPS